MEEETPKNAVSHTDLELNDLIGPKGTPIKVGAVVAKTQGIITSDDEIVYPEILEKIVELAQTGNYDIVVAPEYSFHSKHPLSKEEAHSILRTLAPYSTDTLIIPGTVTWQIGGNMRHTVFMLYGGDLFRDYDKMVDGGEAYIAGLKGLDPVYGSVPGKFEWEGVKLGIEVCRDAGKLSEYEIIDRDVSFLISCGNIELNKTLKSVREGGHAVIVDGHHSYVGAVQQNPQTRVRFESARWK